MTEKKESFFGVRTDDEERSRHFRELFELNKWKDPISGWRKCSDRFVIDATSYSAVFPRASEMFSESYFVDEGNIFINKIGENFVFSVEMFRGRYLIDHPILIEWMTRTRTPSQEEMLQQISRLAASRFEGAIRIERNVQGWGFTHSCTSLSTGEFFIDPWVGETAGLYKSAIEPIREELNRNPRRLLVFAQDRAYCDYCEETGSYIAMPGELIATVDCKPEV